jgi:hypothetical protein
MSNQESPQAGTWTIQSPNAVMLVMIVVAILSPIMVQTYRYYRGLSLIFTFWVLSTDEIVMLNGGFIQWGSSLFMIFGLLRVPFVFQMRRYYQNKIALGQVIISGSIIEIPQILVFVLLLGASVMQPYPLFIPLLVALLLSRLKTIHERKSVDLL